MSSIFTPHTTYYGSIERFICMLTLILSFVWKAWCHFLAFSDEWKTYYEMLKPWMGACTLLCTTFLALLNTHQLIKFLRSDESASCSYLELESLLACCRHHIEHSKEDDQVAKHVSLFGIFSFLIWKSKQPYISILTISTIPDRILGMNWCREDKTKSWGSMKCC